MRLLSASGQNEESLQVAEQAGDLARLAEDERTLAELDRSVAFTLLSMGRPQAALPYVERGIAIADRLGDLETLARTLQSAGAAQTHCGRFEEAQVCAVRSLEATERLGDPVGQVLSHTVAAGALFFLGRWEEAGDWAQRAVTLAESLDTPWYLAWCFWALGMVRLAEGAEEEGHRAMDQAMTLAQAGGNQFVLSAYIAPVLAEWDLFDGRPEQIIARVEAMPWLRQRPAARVLPWLAEAYLQLDDPESAGALVAEGLPAARRDQHRLNLLARLQVGSHLAARQGDSGDARTLLDEALSLSRAMPYPYMEAQLLVDRSRLSLRAGQQEEARTQLEEALMIFRRLGARPHLERTGQALAALEHGALSDHTL